MDGSIPPIEQDVEMASFSTLYPADALEFCPHPAVQDIFACGTYTLDNQAETPVQGRSTQQHRRGQCLVFSINSDGSREPSLEKIQEISLPAVPDMKWCHRSMSVRPILGVADSEGHVTLYEWLETERVLRHIDTMTCAPSNVLCLSLDWSNRRFPGIGLGSLTASLSDGSLCLMNPNTEGGLSATNTWPAHDYEPWIAAWDYWETSLIYSGGDDLQMKAWDIRQGFTQPVWINKRFGAGVTAIQSHPHMEHIFAVGSYDNIVRLFDTRKPLAPLTKTDVGGGVWRVKWHPSASRRGDLLVACMHDGFKVIQFGIQQTDESLSWTEGVTVKHFDKHQSLAYGVDWCFAGSTGSKATTGDTIIGSCSFYDHTIHLWMG